MRPEDHANEIMEWLDDETREIVLDALRVRAMDFVNDRLKTDGEGDLAADIYRYAVPWSDEDRAFDPATYTEQKTT